MSLEDTIHRLSDSRTPFSDTGRRALLLQKLDASIIRRLAAFQGPADPARLRREIVARIAHPSVTADFLTIRTTLSPSLSVLQLLRSEVLERIARWQEIPSWHRYIKWGSVTAILAVLLRITPTFFIASPLHAVAQNVLIPQEGFVSMIEGAQWSVAQSRIDLARPVTIRTGTESTATIVLGDDAVLRLGENAEVFLRHTAFLSPQERHDPIARVIYGQVWFTSLLPESLSTETSLLLPQGVVALRNGSVNITADPEQSTVQVFHGFADVQPLVLPEAAATTAAEPIHLVEGEQLTLLPHSNIQRHVITQGMRTEEWVQVNFSRDAAHRTRITERRQESATSVTGILPTSAFYSLKRASEQIDLWLTFRTEARQAKKMQHAQTRLNEAVALLKQGDRETAESPLAEFREAIRSFASITEEEARELLTSTLLTSSSTVASALPHSDLYPAKQTVLEATTALTTSPIAPEQIDFYLLSDALLGAERLITEGNIEQATNVLDGIEGAVTSVVERQELGETKVEKDMLKAIKTILRSLAFSLTQAEERVKPEQAPALAALKQRMEGNLLSFTAPVTVAVTPKTTCMSPQEVVRRTNRFLADVYTYQTPRAQRNEVLRQISLLPDCPQSGHILSKVMSRVPVFTRSFVWDALQKIGAGT